MRKRLAILAVALWAFPVLAAPPKAPPPPALPKIRPALVVTPKVPKLGVIQGVALAPDGLTPIIFDPILTALDKTTGAPLYPPIPCYHAGLSADGSVIAHPGRKMDIVEIRDTLTGKLTTSFKVDGLNFSYGLYLSADGSLLSAVTFKQHAVMYDVKTGKKLADMPATQYGTCLAYPKSSRLVLLHQGEVSLFDYQKGEQHTLPDDRSGSPVAALFLDEDNNRMFVCRGGLHIWDLKTDKLTKAPLSTDLHYNDSQIALVRGGKELLLVDSGGSGTGKTDLLFLDPKTLRTLRHVTMQNHTASHEDNFYRIQVLDDGNKLIAVRGDKVLKIYVWDLKAVKEPAFELVADN